MSMINVSLVGNLVRAPEQVSFASGRVKTNLRVAVNCSARHANASEDGGDSTEFYKVETWGKLAELALKYLAKGSQVGVAGRLIMEHWTDREGKERLTPVVAAAQLSLPPRSDKGTSSGELPDSDQQLDQQQPLVDAFRHYPQDEEELFAGAKVVAVGEPTRLASVYSSHR